MHSLGLGAAAFASLCPSRGQKEETLYEPTSYVESDLGASAFCSALSFPRVHSRRSGGNVGIAERFPRAVGRALSG